MTQAKKQSTEFNRIAKWIVAAFWMVYVAGLVWLRSNERLGQAEFFAGTVVGALLCIGVTFVWLLFVKGLYRKRIGLVALSIPCLFALSFVFVQIEGVDGSLVPKFRFRWEKPADEKLKQIEKSNDSAIDLVTTTSHDYSRFLGIDAKAAVNIELDTDWSSHPPELLWKKPIGAGWSSFAAVNGYAVTMEQRGPSELTTCYEIESGKLVWSHEVETRHETFMGGIGPRSTPTIHKGRVFASGATGVFRCLDGANGTELWSHDLVKEYGDQGKSDSSVISWGRSGSPLIVDNTVVVPVGGPSKNNLCTLVAFDLESGNEIWRGGKHQISYSSPILCTLESVRQIVAVVQDFVCGFDPATGKQLWQHEWPGPSTSKANVSQPVDIGQNRLFLSKGYSHGSEVIEVRRSGEDWEVESIWAKHNVMKTKFSNVTFYDGHVYGLDDVLLECVDVETGKKKWKNGRFGFGQVLRVGRNLIVQAEDGRVVLIEAAPHRDRQEYGKIQAIEGKTWNNPCLYGPYLLVRNSEEAACYRLKLTP